MVHRIPQRHACRHSQTDSRENKWISSGYLYIVLNHKLAFSRGTWKAGSHCSFVRLGILRAQIHTVKVIHVHMYGIVSHCMHGEYGHLCVSLQKLSPQELVFWVSSFHAFPPTQYTISFWISERLFKLGKQLSTFQLHALAVLRAFTQLPTEKPLSISSDWQWPIAFPNLNL